jgi:hypothetical protein
MLICTCRDLLLHSDDKRNEMIFFLPKMCLDESVTWDLAFLLQFNLYLMTCTSLKFGASKCEWHTQSENFESRLFIFVFLSGHGNLRLFIFSGYIYRLYSRKRKTDWICNLKSKAGAVMVQKVFFWCSCTLGDSRCVGFLEQKVGLGVSFAARVSRVLVRGRLHNTWIASSNNTVF